MKSNSYRSAALLVGAWLAGSSIAQAQGFAASIAPSRFELRAEAGDVIRETVTITNPSEATANYVLKTADWQLDEMSSLHYEEDLLIDGSCRPWVRLERKTITIRPGGRRNYRFEVHVPDDAEPGLCQFAILIGPAEAFAARINDGKISIPVVGRYAVITYVTVGDARPKIENLGLTRVDSNGLRLPAILLRNVGIGHDRASGQVTAVDVSGMRISMIPSTFPILPGRTEVIAFAPELDATGASPLTLDRQLSFPVRLSGRIEVGGGTIEIDAIVD